jgi:DNA (cytosine-5)-methyltransferase 1
MPVNYSEIKKKIKIEVKKPEQTELAHLTHFLQSVENGSQSYFSKEAKKYATEFIDQNSIVNEPWYQGYLPIKWDIPFPPPEKPKFKFIDLFAGIGGFRLAFQNLGGKCVFTSEWNHYAQKTYEANFGEVPFGDIT